MTQMRTDQETLERALCECARFYAEPQNYQTMTIFDREGGHYLLLDQGWDGFKRIHRTWVHVDLVEDKFWVQQDETQDGIAVQLMAAGVRKERIVLAFQHPSRRQYGEFAAA